MPVSGGEVDLTDIKVVGYDPEVGTEDEVYLQSLDYRGRTVAGSMYFWIDVTDGEDVYYGWLNEAGDFVEAGDVTFAPGEGLWVHAPSADFSLQYAGAVDMLGAAVTLREGSKLVSNPKPLDVDLTDVNVTGYDTELGTEDEVYIQSLDYRGRTVAGSMYFWIDVTDGEDVYYGWLNEEGDFIAEGDKILVAGEAIWVNAPSSDFKIVFPGIGNK